MQQQEEDAPDHNLSTNPVGFHRALSIRRVQVNDVEENSSRRSSFNSEDYFDEKKFNYEDEYGDTSDSNMIDNEEFQPLNSPPPIPPPISRPQRKRSKIQPFDITTPQQESSSLFVRIPSVHLSPRIRGSFSKSRRRYQRNNCCNCYYTCCGCSNWPSFCCRLVVLLMVICALIYYMQEQIVWQGTSGDGLVSQKKPTNQVIVTAEDDDLINLASTPVSSSRIRGDYSTVQSTEDLLALAAKVPVQCLDETTNCACAAVHERDNEEAVVNTRISAAPGVLPGWEETHARNVKLANLQAIEPPERLNEWGFVVHNNETAAADNNHTRSLATMPPNVVFLGDSITERWQGTRLGKIATEDMEETHNVFLELFQQSEETNVTNATIHGLPLGIAGDQTPNLLWRLQNGELPDTLHPDIFVVLVGTNDLSRDGCSAENVVVGIVRIVEWLLQEREDAQVLLHGLLPRTFEEDGTLDPGNGHSWGGFLHHHNNNDDDDTADEETPQRHFWPDIQIINDELQGYALFRDRVEYMETNAFFVDTTSGYHLSSAKLKLDMDLMPDGLHPNSDGYRMWGREIKAKLQGMLTTTAGRGK